MYVWCRSVFMKKIAVSSLMYLSCGSIIRRTTDYPSIVWHPSLEVTIDMFSIIVGYSCKIAVVISVMDCISPFSKSHHCVYIECRTSISQWCTLASRVYWSVLDCWNVLEEASISCWLTDSCASWTVDTTFVGVVFCLVFLWNGLHITRYLFSLYLL